MSQGWKDEGGWWCGGVCVCFKCVRVPLQLVCQLLSPLLFVSFCGRDMHEWWGVYNWNGYIFLPDPDQCRKLKCIGLTIKMFCILCVAGVLISLDVFPSPCTLVLTRNLFSASIYLFLSAKPGLAGPLKLPDGPGWWWCNACECGAACVKHGEDASTLPYWPTTVCQKTEEKQKGIESVWERRTRVANGELKESKKERNAANCIDGEETTYCLFTLCKI